MARVAAGDRTLPGLGHEPTAGVAARSRHSRLAAALSPDLHIPDGAWSGALKTAPSPGGRLTNHQLCFPTIGLPVRDLHTRLVQIGADYEHIVIDTPPGIQAIVRSSVLSADTVLIPLSPSGVELRQMAPTFQLLAELEPHTPVLRVLLTQVHARTVTSRVARDLLTNVEVPLLTTEVPHRQSYRTAFGAPPVPSTMRQSSPNCWRQREYTGE